MERKSNQKFVQNKRADQNATIYSMFCSSDIIKEPKENDSRICTIKILLPRIKKKKQENPSQYGESELDNNNRCEYSPRRTVEGDQQA